MQEMWQTIQETVQVSSSTPGTFYQEHTPSILYILNQIKKWLQTGGVLIQTSA